LINPNPINNSLSYGFWVTALIFIFLGLASLLPRIIGLDRFVTTDEVPWLVRSANFYYALGQREFEETYIAEHPGVITMWVESVVYLIDYPQYRGFGQGYFDSDKYAQFEEFIVSLGIEPHNILVKSRTIIVIINAALLLAAFYFGRLLVGSIPALFSFLLIAFDPFHIATTRLAHLDGLTSGFLFLSLLSFLAFLLKSRKRYYLVTSAVSGGLAWLAKLNGLIILPAIIIFSLIDLIINRKKSNNTDANSLSLITSQVIKPVFIWMIFFVLTVLIVFPAAWENPVDTIAELTTSPLLVGKIIPTQRVEGTLIPTEGENNPIDIFRTFFNNNSQVTFLSKPSNFYMRYIKGYLGRANPIIFIGLAAAILGYIYKFGFLENKVIRQLVFYLALFWLIYTVFVTLASKSSPKYYLPIYPVLDLIAGLGLFTFVDHFTNNSKYFRNKITRSLPLLLIITLYIIPIFKTYPYYSTYFNPLRRLWSESSEIIYAGSGEGLDQAAQYLNRKPNSESLKVMSWYATGPFSYFFNGQTQPLFSYVWTEDQITILKEMDYLVIYSGQWIRNMPMGLPEVLEHVEPEHTIWIDGIEFARIYSVEGLPKEVFQPYTAEN
jgi:4-amino-4-deoxy-L-arabinose transferase-like glycosyltransferase